MIARYLELINHGAGGPTAFTGLTWTGFRPSDDKTAHGFNIPGNMYVAGALQRVLALNSAVWKDSNLGAKAVQLLEDIEAGLAEYGTVEVAPGLRVYAYEVDGLGEGDEHVLADFDDANVPSLLSIPLLGWDQYDRHIYAATRQRLLDPRHNQYYFKGAEIEGIGSQHTGLG